MVIPKLKTFDRKDTLIFLIGLFSMIKVRFLGTFGLAEILIFGLYFFIKNPFVFLQNKNTTHFFLATCVWLIGVFISDRYNNIEFIDSLKGLFNVLFLLALIPFSYWILYEKPERSLFFWTGLAISSFLGFKLGGASELTEIEYDTWKVYAIKFIFLITGGWLYYNGKQKWAYIIVELFALWTLWHMSRNVFLICTIAVCLTIFIGQVSETDKIVKGIKFRKNIIKVFLILGIAFVGITYTYEKLVSNKYLGEVAYKKYEKQKNSEIGLASGRIDFFEALYAASKKPILGWGSYAKDNGKIREEFHNKIGSEYMGSYEIVPSHSHILGAWVFAGVFGLFFWLYVLKIIYNFFMNGLFVNIRMLFFNLLILCSMLWDIFFSPFNNRLPFIIFMITIILLTHKNCEYEKK